jgi:hypothetical protein
MVVEIVLSTAVLTEVVDPGNPVSAGEQLLDHVTPDESRRAG